MADDDLAQNPDLAFDLAFDDGQDQLPDAGTMVASEHGSLAQSRPEPAAPAAPSVEDEVRQVVDDRMARQQAEQRSRALEQQIAEQRRASAPKPEVPDFFVDPNAFIRAQIEAGVSPVQQRLQDAIMFNARLTANTIHTEDEVKTAETAFNEAAKSGKMDRADHARIQNSPNPFHEAVLWNRRQSVLKEVGDDPAAYRKRLEDELMKDPQFQARVIAASNGRPMAAVPTSASVPAAQAAPPRRTMPGSIASVGNAQSATAVARDLEPEDAYGALTND